MFPSTLLLWSLLAVAVVWGRFPDLALRHDYTFSTKSPFFYLDGHTLPFYDFYGNAVPSHDHIRLTQSSVDMKGSVWSKAKNSHPNWMLELQFHVRGPGQVGGHGLVFWYTKERGVPAHIAQADLSSAGNVDPTGSSLGPFYGATDRWDGLAVVLDTFDESNGARNNPLIYGLLNAGDTDFATMHDPSEKHIGQCYQNYRNTDMTVYMRVLYVEGLLEVWMDTHRHGQEFELCFSTKVKLPTDHYFGVSASTGQMPDDHDIVAIDTYEVNPRLTTDQERYRHEEHRDAAFEKVRQQVEEAREKAERTHEQHIGHDAGSIQLMRIQETQFNILTQLEQLASRQLPTATSGTGSTGSSCDYKDELKVIRADLQHVDSTQNLIMSLLKEMAEYVSHTSQSSDKGENAHFASVLGELSTKMNALHSTTSNVARHAEAAATASAASIHWSPLMLLSVFLVCQVAVMFIYSSWKGRETEKSKKFI